MDQSGQYFAFGYIWLVRKTATSGNIMVTNIITVKFDYNRTNDCRPIGGYNRQRVLAQVYIYVIKYVTNQCR